MSETSSIPAFQDELISTVSALSAFAGVPFTLGSPVGPWPRDCCYLGDVAIDEQSHELGNMERREQFEQDVYISSVREGTIQSDPRDKAFALRDAIAGQLKSDSTIGGTVIWAQMGGGSLSAKADAERRECELRLVIRCMSII